MSRKYLNERWCVRCNRKDATPYLRQHWRDLVRDDITDNAKYTQSIVDLGCGNGRNSEYLRTQGYGNVLGVDMATETGTKCILGQDTLPVPDNSVDAVLANYVFMFLSKPERKQVVAELQRICRPGCRLMIELYPAKDSETPDDAAVTKLQAELIRQLGWEVIHEVKERCLLRK